MSKVAVVTGAGSGVGRAVALELAKRGFAVALVGRRQDVLEETIRAAGKAAGRLLAIGCDISIENQVTLMAQRVAGELGAASVLVKMNVTPIVVMNYMFGGDNHGDAGLAIESNAAVASCASSLAKTSNASHGVPSAAARSHGSVRRSSTMWGSRSPNAPLESGTG